MNKEESLKELPGALVEWFFQLKITSQTRDVLSARPLVYHMWGHRFGYQHTPSSTHQPPLFLLTIIKIYNGLSL
jgi:hypothetical protein